MTATLTEIIEHKRRQVAAIMGYRSLAEVRAEAEAARPADIRDFFSAVAAADTGPGPIAIIAEIKRRSPSAGQIRPEYAGESFAPERIARLYTEHGASAISCLTDEKFFDGHPDFIRRVKAATPLPVLRKDFLIDPRQIWESRALGADAVLLIAECLPGDQLAAMADEAAAAGLTALIEIHDEGNLERAAELVGTPTVPGGRTAVDMSNKNEPHRPTQGEEQAGAAPPLERPYSSERPTRPPGTVGVPSAPRRLLGINNRNLAAMTTDLAHTLRLAAGLPAETRRLLVSESGIRRREDLDALAAAGVTAALVGESLMRDENPGAALARLLGG